MNKLIIFALLFSTSIYSQSDFEKVLKIGEILVNGLSFFKSGKSKRNKIWAVHIENYI